MPYSGTARALPSLGRRQAVRLTALLCLARVLLARHASADRYLDRLRELNPASDTSARLPSRNIRSRRPASREVSSDMSWLKSDPCSLVRALERVCLVS